jgi:hypothetical protein
MVRIPDVEDAEARAKIGAAQQLGIVGIVDRAVVAVIAHDRRQDESEPGVRWCLGRAC